MPIRMLIDASHQEETRVAIVHGNRVEDFDFESAAKKQIKGNIYLAKVTRVEPSLQAAFVDYGGNRHGFLAFSEIHPDYYQIPVADRQALLAEDAEAQQDLTEFDTSENDAAPQAGTEQAETEDDDHHEGLETVNNDNDSAVESLEHDDELAENIRRRPRLIKRHYKIQEVIKRRQILLIQVVKEERGNKGAALTTYLSLAGRYCVLMPNTLHGGGVSRKIANPADRKKLKSVLAELKMQEGMACIIRTAGLSRTRAEIKRDFDYLTRLWEGIRELTLRSIAPAMIYEEGDLIKRSIRDLYSRDIDEIQVEGEDGYKAAKSFMRLLMPSHAKRVQHYKGRVPLFHRFQVEGQLDSMFSPDVQLKSGGYIVINPTEALVSIDVNSGKATREHHIEETAYKTNIEAAEEISRQLRLRDMAGLIVIDFIDMEDRNNNRNVERKLKECLKSDRARIQVGRISPFGLMEMSRQRLRPGVLEASTQSCPVCSGSGFVRSIESAALHALRMIEEEGIRARSSFIHVRVAIDVAIYLLNKKRDGIINMEHRYGFRIEILADHALISPAVEIDREGNGPDPELVSEYITAEGVLIEPEIIEAESDATENTERSEAKADRTEKEEPRRKKRRRRRKKSGQAEQQPEQNTSDEIEQSGTGEPQVQNARDDGSTAGEDGDNSQRKRRRRGRRGGRKRGRVGNNQHENLVDDQTSSGTETGNQSSGSHEGDLPAPPQQPVEPAAETPVATDTEIPEKTAKETAAETDKPNPRRRRKAPAKDKAAEQAVETTDTVPETEDKPAPKKRTRTRKKPPVEDKAKKTADTEAESKPKPASVQEKKPATVPEVVIADAGSDGKVEPAQADTPPKPRRKGWWQRTFGE